MLVRCGMLYPLPTISPWRAPFATSCPKLNLYRRIQSDKGKRGASVRASSDELAMHQRLLSGDPVARADVIAALYDDVARGVQRRAGDDCDLAIAEEQAGEALLRYAEDPTRYDSERGSLHDYLVMTGHSRYRDALRRDRRHGAGLPSLSDPRIAAVADHADESVMDELIADLDAAQLKGDLIAHFNNPQDRAVADMVLDGVPGWEPYVEALGLASLSEEQQRTEVYRVKSRVKKRLQRLGGSFNEPR